MWSRSSALPFLRLLKPSACDRNPHLVLRIFFWPVIGPAADGRPLWKAQFAAAIAPPRCWRAPLAHASVSFYRTCLDCLGPSVPALLERSIRAFFTVRRLTLDLLLLPSLTSRALLPGIVKCRLTDG